MNLGINILQRQDMDFKLNKYKFKDFDEFLVFAIKYWVLIRDNQEDLNKAFSQFQILCNRFNLSVESKEFDNVMEEYNNILFNEMNPSKAIGKFCKLLELLKYSSNEYVKFFSKLGYKTGWK